MATKNDREKLIELLESAESAVYWDSTDKGFIQKIADYLLANGVRLEESQATSDKTSEEQPGEIDFDYSAEDDNG